MDGIWGFYFKQERLLKNLSSKSIAMVSLVDQTDLRKFESNELILDENQKIRLFSSVGINYKRIYKLCEVIMKDIRNIVYKIIMYDILKFWKKTYWNIKIIPLIIFF